MNPLLFLAVWLVIINALTIYAIVRDKRASRRGQWRIPESHLLFLALLGGALGEWIAMYTVRHKIRKARFVLLIPLMAVLQIAGVILLILCWGGNL